ncbi:phage head spike fiber domain-containing protein [Aeromonas caviae]|uniref:phage head spike fiber domain-containing protein n=1 Tax=Aeromonas caviae TaxID=648 RepID=UPI0038D1CA9B
MAGIWYRAGTVVVTSGSTKVVGTGTTWRSGVYKPDKGHIFWGPDGRAYEVDYVESDTVLYLVTAYAGGSATGQAYSIVISITGQVPAFSRELSAFVAYHQGQMDGWQQLLTGTGDVTLTAPDGTKKTVPSWDKVMNAGYGVVAQATAQAIIATAEAAKAAASAGVAADIVAAAALPIPDLWAPLTDDLRLITGHGREVKVGDDVVAKMVNFSRSTTKTYRAKDGALKIAAINEPAFEAEGLLIEGASTNAIKHHATPILVGMSEVGKATDPLGGVDGAKVFSVINPGDNVLRFGDAVSGVATDIKTSSCYVRSIGKPADFVIECEDAAPALVHVEADTWVRITTTRKNPSAIYSGFFDISVLNGNAGDKVAVWGAQLEVLPFMTSLILTTGAAATRAADVACVDLRNLPIGMSLTIACESDTQSGDLGVVITAARLSAGYWGMWRGNSGGNHLFTASFYDEISAIENALRDQSAIHAARFNAETMRASVVVNGRELRSASVTKQPVTAATHLYLGAAPDGQYPLFGHIRNLRIWLRPLSDEQMKAIA